MIDSINSDVKRMFSINLGASGSRLKVELEDEGGNGQNARVSLIGGQWGYATSKRHIEGLEEGIELNIVGTLELDDFINGLIEIQKKM